MENISTWTDKVRKAAELIGNQEATDRIEAALVDDLGLTKDETGLVDLSDDSITPFGDLRAALERQGFKLIQVRKIVSALRGEQTGAKVGQGRPEVLKVKYGLKDSIKTARIQDLVADYDPNEPDDPVAQELKRRFGEEKVIVLDPHAESPTVAIAETLDLMADFRDGRGLSDKVMVDGLLVEPFAVGQKPVLILDEDPLFVGEALRQNGRSNKESRLDWSEITQAARQFVRVAVETGAIEPTSRRDSKDIWTLARGGIAPLNAEFPEVGLEYRNRKKTDNLPKLKVSMGQVRKNSPFSMGGNRIR